MYSSHTSNVLGVGRLGVGSEKITFSSGAGFGPFFPVASYALVFRVGRLCGKTGLFIIVYFI